ncbi:MULTISPECIES: hypothetical protein [Rothia]|uniref:hypothetical protein n=1 Tax=Rothia TaxID=32207 RepID=UPI001F15DC7D|nr:hypothetical protein [Rothia nasimurium]
MSYFIGVFPLAIFSIGFVVIFCCIKRPAKYLIMEKFAGFAFQTGLAIAAISGAIHMAVVTSLISYTTALGVSVSEVPENLDNDRIWEMVSMLQEYSDEAFYIAICAAILCLLGIIFSVVATLIKEI